MSTRPDQFLIKVRTERTNLHRQQRQLIEDMYRVGEITKEERIKMLTELQREWN